MNSPPSPDTATRSAPIGVIGGSGFYTWLAEAVAVPVETPFGPPSEPPLVGEVDGVPVAFIPRHGRDHRFAPHRVNYRANLWALRAVGVRDVIGPCAVGALRPDLPPGMLLIPDQLIDRTWGREHTIFDNYQGQSTDHSGAVVHIAFADPYCPRGRLAVLDRATAADSTGPSGEASGEPWSVHDGGTMVVINGPRFSTRAESRWHADAGGDVVGMTGAPEAAIARELGLCYTSVAIVTDHDAGVEAGQGVTHAEVMAAFARSVTGLRTLLGTVAADLSAQRASAAITCTCAGSITDQVLPFDLP